MKRIIMSLSILLVFAVSANAELLNNSDGTITDTDTNLMWLRDADYAGTSGYVEANWYGYHTMNWAESMTWAENLVFAGYDDWRLPDADPPCGTGGGCVNSEMGHLYFVELGNINGGPLTNTGLFFNLQAHPYWTRTEYDVNSSFVTEFQNGFQNPSLQSNEALAWAVRDISVVPEPISSILFIVGGATLGFRRFIKKFKKCLY